MAFSESFLEELNNRNEICDVISGYISLTPKGGNMFGLCPFHSEKTPSFSVTPDKQLYYCFGCGCGGTVLNFVMEIENLSYPDAVHFLAKRAGLTVQDDDSQEYHRLRERLLALNRDAGRFFHSMLHTPSCAHVVSYIGRRRITKDSVTKFGLGAAPDSWDALTQAMSQKGYENAELIAAGLALSGKKGGIYDRFRNRLIFPIIDLRGDVIGFGGRVMDDSTPKYLNSPESIVFNKSKNLFGLNLAKKTKRSYILLTEGYMDTLSLHQAGFDCAVASLGTALTPDHGRLLSRYTKEVIIAYDTDEAGRKAAQRAIQVLERSGIKVKLIAMKGAKDPDEYIKKFGKPAFEALLSHSENHIEYRMTALIQGCNLEEDEGRIKFLKEGVTLLSSLDSPVEREVYGVRIAEAAGVSPEAVALEVKQAAKQLYKKEKRQHEREVLAPERTFQPKDRAMRYENVKSATAEEGLIRLRLLEPQLFEKDMDIEPDDFTSPFLKKAWESMEKRRAEEKPISLPAMSGIFTQEEMSRLSMILQKPENLKNSKSALQDYIETIKNEKLKNSEDLAAITKLYREKKGYGG